ncbi:putative serine hydrolase [Frankliniella fusca]|uniref:Serine hydrolase n=1 Tax=Frankliniella fusca TaxID=407009 RepID=A0AAE1LTC3_9NEOP|nr:putative serine hydrolase [Frankliniella fusca]
MNPSVCTATTGLRSAFKIHNIRPVCGLKLHTSPILSAKTVPSLSTHEEIEIPVPWGHISGKWWGRKDVTPVIGLHGFEDNAGSFDRLAPMLNLPAFLALDAIGHGKSSHIPPGMVYTFIDFVIAFRRVVKYYGWKQFSIIGHSFGSTMGHIYASIYPGEVDKFVTLDCTRTFMATIGMGGVTGAPRLRLITEKCLKADKDRTREPPAYTREEMVTALCKGSMDSVLKEHVHPLMERGSTVHPSKPNHFYFTRDQKLRQSDFNRPSLELLEESAKNIKCHVLTILATGGYVNLCKDSLQEKTFNKFEGLIKDSAPSYKRLDVVGTHHVHLNDPKNVAPHINDFFSS